VFDSEAGGKDPLGSGSFIAVDQIFPDASPLVPCRAVRFDRRFLRGAHTADPAAALRSRRIRARSRRLADVEGDGPLQGLLRASHALVLLRPSSLLSLDPGRRVVRKRAPLPDGGPRTVAGADRAGDVPGVPDRTSLAGRPHRPGGGPVLPGSAGGPAK